MTDTQGYQEKIKEISEQYQSAEDCIKTFEGWFHEDGLGIFTPAINQLRYAGYHLLRAMNENPPNESELNKSLNHCLRASLDASEASAIAALSSYNEFRRRFCKIPISDVVKNYGEIAKRFRELKRLVSKLDGTKTKDRIEQHDTLISAAKQALEDMDVLLGSEEELKIRARRDRLRAWLIPILTSVFGALVGAIITAVIG